MRTITRAAFAEIKQGREAARKKLDTVFKVWLYNLADRKGVSTATILAIRTIKQYEKSIADSIGEVSEWFKDKKVKKSSGKPIRWAVVYRRNNRRL